MSTPHTNSTRAITPRRSLQALVALVLGLCTVAALGGTAEAKEWNIKSAKAGLAKTLRAEQLTPKQIYTCRVKKPATLTCKFSVSGTLPDASPYRCSGNARKKGSGTWKRSPCYIALLYDQLVQRNRQPRTLIGCAPKKGVVQCSWSAEGTWPGEVPYRCGGDARYSIRSRIWQIDPCDNFYGDVEPLLDTPNPKPVFGFNEDWINQSTRQYLDDTAAIGATTDRVGLVWDGVEYSRGTYDWKFYDRLYAQFRAAGVKPLWVLGGPPCWAQDNPTQCKTMDPNTARTYPPAEGQLAAFAAFAKAAAARYPQSQGIEIWNEPNHPGFWNPKLDPERYGRMVRYVSGQLAPVTPIPIVSAGLSPLESDDPDGGGLSDTTFLRRVYQSGGFGPVDAIGVHVYYYDPVSYELRIRKDFAEFYKVMDQNGDSRPVWVTETGSDSSDVFTNEGQAQALVDTYNLLRRIRSIPVVVVHRFLDGAQKVPGPGIDYYGVYDTAGQPKPAYCALGLLATEVAPPWCS